MRSHTKIFIWVITALSNFLGFSTKEIEFEYKERTNITDFITNQTNSTTHQAFAGYIQVRDNGSRIFYHLYSAYLSPLNDDSKPLIIWLQGGPGCSSEIGSFQEIGPYLLKFRNGRYAINI